MESVIDQAFSNIQLTDAGLLFQRTDVENTFVRHATITASVEHRIGRLQTAGNVVGIQNRDRAGLFQPFSAHHANVHPADWQNGCTAKRRCGYGALLRQHTVNLHHAVSRHKRGQVRFDANRSHTRTAAAVRNAEGFMQIQVRDIRADIARRGDADLRIHVRAIQINLTAILMHDLAHFADGLFINAVR